MCAHRASDRGYLSVAWPHYLLHQHSRDRVVTEVYHGVGLLFATVFCSTPLFCCFFLRLVLVIHCAHHRHDSHCRTAVSTTLLSTPCVEVQAERDYSYVQQNQAHGTGNAAAAGKERRAGRRNRKKNEAFPLATKNNTENQQVTEPRTENREPSKNQLLPSKLPSGRVILLSAVGFLSPSC